MDPSAGAKALEEDLPRILALEGAQNIEALGWRRPNNLTLLIPLEGPRPGGPDRFLLKLGFQSYREWPPSAQFVNPQTLRFELGPDNVHVPQLTSDECRTHVSYSHPRGGTIQLICCSATLEFYEVAHGVAGRHVWDGKSTFLSTIVAIRRALTESYTGRFPANG